MTREIKGRARHTFLANLHALIVRAGVDLAMTRLDRGGSIRRVVVLRAVPRRWGGHAALGSREHGTSPTRGRTTGTGGSAARMEHLEMILGVHQFAETHTLEEPRVGGRKLPRGEDSTVPLGWPVSACCLQWSPSHTDFTTATHCSTRTVRRHIKRHKAAIQSEHRLSDQQTCWSRGFRRPGWRGFRNGSPYSHTPTSTHHIHTTLGAKRSANKSNAAINADAR